MILVTGGSGTSGKPIVQQLSESGASVRVLVRDPAKASDLRLPGVELVQGDFSDPASVERACRGVERVLLNSQGAPELVRMQSQLIKAAQRAGVRHVVKFSVQDASPSARYSFGRWHGITEEELKASGMAWTMLRPTFFMQNFLGAPAEQVRQGGAFYQPAGRGTAAYVDVRDIAAVAVKALTEDGHAGKSYLITGPQDLSCDDIAASISRVIGKPVKYVDAPRDAAKQAMLQAGMPEWQAEAICELADLLRDGAMAGTTSVVLDVAKRPPVTFDQFAREHAPALA